MVEVDVKTVLDVEPWIQQHIDRQIAAGLALRKIRDKRLWHPEYKSFAKYCWQRFEMKPGEYSRLIKWATAREAKKCPHLANPPRADVAE